MIVDLRVCLDTRGLVDTGACVRRSSDGYDGPSEAGSVTASTPCTCSCFAFRSARACCGVRGRVQHPSRCRTGHSVRAKHGILSCTSVSCQDYITAHRKGQSSSRPKRQTRSLLPTCGRPTAQCTLCALARSAWLDTHGCRPARLTQEEQASLSTSRCLLSCPGPTRPRRSRRRGALWAGWQSRRRA